MNKIIQTIQHTARAATVLLLALLTTMTAWAEDIATYYLDKDGTRHDVNATVLTGNEPVNQSGEIKLYDGWYVVNSNIEYTDVVINCSSDINLILADGTTMTANNSNSDGIAILGSNLTIYGQTLGTGTLDATSNTETAIYYSGDIIINGGIVKATSIEYNAIFAYDNLIINGGTVNAKGKYGLNVGNITINGGNVTATGGDDGQGINAIEGTITINGGIVDAKGGSGLYAPNIAINGGKVTATATATGNTWAGINASYNGTITLGWTRASDFIQANSYSGTVSVKGSLAFLTDDATPVTISGNNIDPASINGRKLTPDLSAGLIENGDTYTINNATGWDFFCDMLEAGETFSGKTVKLANDITVTRMAGGQPFQGTFDGDGHKLTLAYGTADAPVDAQFVAPFVETARDTSPVFRNLTIDGTIYDGYTGSEAHNVGGLIGHLFGTVTIEHCVSRVEIHAKVGAGGFVGLCEHSVSFTDCHSAAVVHSADGSNSGFVAWSRDSGWEINFTGCLFDGKLLQQNGSGASNGGFIGWKGDAKTVNITNCLCAPATLADGETMATDGSATFSREHSDHPATIKNSYYTQTLGNAQGKQARAVTAGTDVTVAHAGVATHYATSGITAYKATGASADSDPFIAGLLYNNNVVDVLYAGIDDVVSLTLSNTATGDVPDGYQYGYTTNAGTLSGTGNPYTLTMSAADVTVSLALRSTGELVRVSYLDVDGTPQTAQAIALDGTETGLGIDGTETWYFVGLPTVIFDHRLNLSGDVHLILADGSTMNVTSNADGIDVNGSLTIYGQTDGTGTLNATSVYGDGISTSSGNITISGGRVTATGYNGIITDSGNITISGGRVTVTGDNTGIFTISGTITLGCTTASDFIYVSSYFVNPGEGSLNIADDQTLYDEDGIFYSGNGVIIPDGKTLQPSVFDLTARQAPDGNYWTTYYNSALGFTIGAEENACAYTATYSAGQLTLHNLGKEIPKNTAVIIVAENNVVSMTATTLPAYTGDNDLRGVNVDTQTSALGTGTFYVLGKTTVGDDEHFGFHRYTGEEMAAHKAFVFVSGTNLARSLTMVFDEATGIESLTPDAAPKAQAAQHWFTLDGRRLQAKPTAPGIYINNGRKVMIK